MKTKMIWFTIGFIVSWLTWSAISYVRLHPRNYTQSCSESDEMRIVDWLRLAKGRNLGSFHVFTPSASPNASAIIHPSKSNCFPQIWIQDIDKDGKLDNILVFGSEYHTVSVDDKDEDGVIDSYGYTLKGNTDSISYTDFNMDGQYDMRLNPDNTSSIFIDSQWYSLIIKDKERYIDINGTITQVKADKNVWRIIEK